MSSRLLPALVLAAVTLTMAACSEDYYGELACTGIDTLVVYPREEVQHLTVIDDPAGMAGLETLSLGSSGGTRSDILLEYDFGAIAEDYPDVPDSLYDPAHLRSVALRLRWLPPASTEHDSIPPSLGVEFEVRTLAGGFDPRDYVTAPGPAVSLDGSILNGNASGPDFENELLLELNEEDLVGWLDAGDPVAMVVTAGAGSDSGLAAFASGETPNYGYSYAPSIVVNFHDYGVGPLQITPIHDTSTFDEVTELPTDMIHLQTGPMSYPVLTFDIPPLPADASKYVMYGFHFFADHIDSPWTDVCLQLSQVGQDVPPDPADPVLAADLAAASTDLFRICPGGDTGDDPDHFVSRAYPRWEPAPPSVMRVLFTFAGYYSGFPRIDPDHVFTQSTFHGPTAAAGLRPVLLVLTCDREE